MGVPAPARFARVAAVGLIGADGLARLRASRAAVIGVGNVGGQLVPHLAMLGVGGLFLIDHDKVCEENGTQGFSERDLGLPKVEARARALARLGLSCEVEGLQAEVERLGLGTLRDVDLIFACPDTIDTRLFVSDTARRLGRPWVDVAVDGSGKTFVSRMAAYGASPDAPCYRCQWSPERLRAAVRGEEPRGCPRWRWGGGAPATEPTVAVAAVGGAIAAAAAVVGLKVLLGRGEEVFGRETFLDLDRGSLSTHGLARDPQCVFDHRPLALEPLGRTPASETVEETLSRAESRLGSGATLSLHRGAAVVAEVRCPVCAAVRRPFRLLEAIREGEGRCGCGAPMQPVAAGLLSRFGRAEALPFLDRSWEAIGLPPEDVVTAARGRTEIHMLFAC